MAGSWEKMGDAKENQHFERENNEALARLKARQGSAKRLSPVTGKPMEQVTLMGVVVDKCESGGIWLDAGELEQILAAASSQSTPGWTEKFFGGLFPKK